MSIVGTWHLKTWRRVQPDGCYAYPFGEAPHGLLIYAADGYMAVQMTMAGRPLIDSNDATTGPIEQRAQAYSTCLAYVGRYDADDHQVVHHIDVSLYPNWSNQDQVRPFVMNDNELVLKVLAADGTLTNEMLWTRATSGPSTSIAPHEERNMSRRDDFLRLSEALTGFGRFELLGTGQADTYLQFLEAVLPAPWLDKLLAVARDVPTGADEEETMTHRILADPELKPVAQNLALLWYCGTWGGMPEAWRAAHGRSPLDTPHTVSADAYLSGLQWAAAGAHPAGGQMQGFATWSLAPEQASHA